MTHGASTQVKICGIRTPEEARGAIEAGADWIGLNFHAPSPRAVDVASAHALRALIGTRARVAGVFVDRPAGEVGAIARELALDAVQLHGNEAPAEFQTLGVPVVRALRVRGAESLEELDAWPFALALLLAGGGGGGRFGGQTFDWSLWPRKALDRELWLAGGLTPQNVGEAIRQVRPALVDVASGVEALPGRKDSRLMRAFIEAARKEAM